MISKLSNSLLVALSLISFNLLSLSATTNTDIDYNNRLTQGTDIYYWISPTCEYTNSIPNAAQKLMYPPSSVGTNPLILNRTYTNSASKMDFYQYSKTDYINAYTMTYRKNTSGNYYAMPVSEKEKYDWVYGEIYINDNYMNNYSTSTREAVILHEMLHVYGLKDISNANSIMYYATPNAKTMTKDANDAINKKY